MPKNQNIYIKNLNLRNTNAVSPLWLRTSSDVLKLMS